MSSSEISSTSLANPFRESGTPRNWKSQLFAEFCHSLRVVALFVRWDFVKIFWRRPHQIAKVSLLNGRLERTKPAFIICISLCWADNFFYGFFRSSYKLFSKWLITCHRSLISIVQLTLCCTWTEASWSVGCHSRRAGFRAGGGFSTLSPPSPRALCQPSTWPRPSCVNPWWRPHYEFWFFWPSNRLTLQEKVELKFIHISIASRTDDITQTNKPFLGLLLWERRIEQRLSKTLQRDAQRLILQFDGPSSSKCWRKPTTCTLE